MAVVDWLVVVAFIGLTLGTGLWFMRRASKSMADYFVGGRSIPWWLAGTSMLATSFASDTPLHTTRAIREGGLSQAWFYWNGIISGVVIAFLFAKMWRRAGVVTDNELIELRYSGKPAAWLRGGLALFKSCFLEILTMAWITLGMVKIVKTIMELPERIAIFGVFIQTELVVVVALLIVAIAFSVASGFWGVVATDLAEFSIAMGGAIVLAVVAMNKVGGTAGLREGLKLHAPMGEAALDFTPNFLDGGGSVLAFGVYIGLQWWARNEVDGSGQRAQRLLACKDERHAIAAGVWSLAVTWLIRSWPWYVTALASLVLYPSIADHESVYPRMVADLMPIGLKGLMVASFFAAFMGTLEAHYNLTASYVVNDVYKRFLRKDADEKHYVNISRLTTLVVALIAAVATLLLPSILGAFRFKMELVSGLGLIYILRWFWWRVTAMTEIVALLTSVASALTLNVLLPAPTPAQGAHYSALRLLLVVLISGVASIAATFLVRPEPTAHLLTFYRRVRPPKRFWGPIAAEAGEVGPSEIGWQTLAQALLAIAFVFSGMIGIGKLVLGQPIFGAVLVAFATVSGALMLRWLFGSKQRAV
jgi:solute:Na+ symporter, SSS family